MFYRLKKAETMLRTKILRIIIVLLLDRRSANPLLVLSALMKIFILSIT